MEPKKRVFEKNNYIFWGSSEALYVDIHTLHTSGQPDLKNWGAIMVAFGWWSFPLRIGKLYLEPQNLPKSPGVVGEIWWSFWWSLVVVGVASRCFYVRPSTSDMLFFWCSESARCKVQITTGIFQIMQEVSPANIARLPNVLKPLKSYIHWSDPVPSMKS